MDLTGCPPVDSSHAAVPSHVPIKKKKGPVAQFCAKLSFFNNKTFIQQTSDKSGLHQMSRARISFN